MPRFRAGVIGILVIAAACYLVFGGGLPVSGSPFVLTAVFTANTNLHVPSPVRIAGVTVGQVTGVQRISSNSDAAVVSMDIDPTGLPIHDNATLKIRPRIFLEGNFYVDLQPGTPEAPVIASGGTIPVANTSGPVQLDRVLSSLSYDTRENLQTLLQGLGASLSLPPTAAQDATQDPSVRGLTGAQALNQTLKYSADALRASAIVNEALLGTHPHDLSQVVSGNQRIFSALAASQSELVGLITNFNITLGAFASRQQQLSQTIAALPPLLRNSNAAFSALDASFGPTKTFARQILPGVNETNATITAALPWLAQVQALVSPSELGGLLTDLTPAVQNTASTIASSKSLFTGLDLLAHCFVHNVIPTGNVTISDPPVSSGIPVYQEFYQTAVGLAGSAQNFDGNGRYIRVQTAGGSDLINTSSLPQQGPLYGNAVLPPLGTRPAWPGVEPPYNRGVACFKNAAPNLNSAQTGAGP